MERHRRFAEEKKWKKTFCISAPEKDLIAGKERRREGMRVQRKYIGRESILHLKKKDFIGGRETLRENPGMACGTSIGYDLANR